MPEIMTGSQVIAKVLKEEGTEFVAGIVGGGIFNLMEAWDQAGIPFVHVRDEQTGAFIADGWGRATGKAGVCFCDAQYGIVNMIAGVSHMYQCRTPAVCFTSCRPAVMNDRATHRVGYAESTCSNFTKWSKRIQDWRSISFIIQRAFKIANTYPQGPVLIEIPSDLEEQKGDLREQLGYLPNERAGELGVPQADPRMVEKAVRLLLQAERPMIVAGEDVHWTGAQEELKEFVELMNIPVFTTRMGRGAIPEDHPLAFRGGYAVPFNRRTDVAVAFGLFMASGEMFGQLPGYNPLGKYILVSQFVDDINAPVTSEARILANPKAALRQFIDCAKDLKKSIKTPAVRQEWLDAIAKAKEAYRAKQIAQKEEVRNGRPINPHFLAYEICDFLDKDSTIIEDSMYMSHFTSPKFVARHSGQVMDASGTAAVGHSVGMALGAQLARPGKQVLALIGDGGLGISGMDLETGVRYSLPVVFVLHNNSGWTSPESQKPYYKNLGYRFALAYSQNIDFLPDIRYDKMFAEMGCHTEYVTEPEQIKPALERAFNSGRTSLLNVITDPKIFPPFVMQTEILRLMY